MPRLRRLYAAVFLAGAALMGLEIVGSRVLAPHFGTSVFVWGSLITTFLGSLALGYALGGRLADRRPDPRLLADLLVAAAVLLFLVFQRPEPILAFFARLAIPERFQSLLAAIVLFGPPSVLMGIVTPFAVKLATRDVETVGTSAGRLSAISTAGSIVGTFLTTFFFVPAFGTEPIIQGIGVALLVSAVLVPARHGGRRLAAYGTVLVLALAIGIGAKALQGTAESDVRVVYEKETAYHRIRVLEQETRRALVFDRLTQGLMAVGKNDRRPPNYTDGLAFALGVPRTPPRRVVIIGLGAGMLPDLLSRGAPEIVTTSIEIDPEVVKVARDWFAFEPDANDVVLVGDGRRALETKVDGADAILLDAFFAEGVPFHLTTQEFARLCHSKLSPEGVYAANFVGSLTGADNQLFWATVKTLRSVFPQVLVLQDELASAAADGQAGSTFDGNAVLIASKGTGLSREDVRDRALALATRLGRPEMMTWGARWFEGPYPVESVPILTDSYSPTDALQHLGKHR